MTKPLTASRKKKNSPRVGLVSMPWITTSMPSIQLSTLKAALLYNGIASDIFELNLDYASRIGINIYHLLSRTIGFTAEWVFTRFVFKNERTEDIFLNKAPSFGMKNNETERRIYNALHPVTEKYLNDMMHYQDWKKYDFIGFSLSLTQIGASAALAKRIKQQHPEIKIVFGGSQCSEEMGEAMLRTFSFVDYVVKYEGEYILPELINNLRSGKPINTIPGICYRTENGYIHSSDSMPKPFDRRHRKNIEYDSYFTRLRKLKLQDSIDTWIPFESGRGCWYGEKTHCTFCGLNHEMSFREWPSNLVFNELKHLSKRHGINQFFSVDLVMPKSYPRTFFPKVEKLNRNWMFFYETRASLSRSELEQLSSAGVRWIQPGIESLDGYMLKIMRKGVTVMQNIQLLKWSRELGIRVGWNLITGIPGEKKESYQWMLKIMPLLVHLAPPSGVGHFQLHRFSPFFENPAKHGVTKKGAHPLYKYVFPVPNKLLDNLIYLHDYRLNTRLSKIWHKKLENEVKNWWSAYRKKARLTWTATKRDQYQIIDTRFDDANERCYTLNADEMNLYRFLDSSRSIKRVPDDFTSSSPKISRQLGGTSGIKNLLKHWQDNSLTLEANNQVQNLAIDHKLFLKNNKMHPQKIVPPKA
ncbi:MAG: RiPP maturation radical SAM C-methyltransferase [Candidatus Scalindua sp.]|nr:RiPP maturation radical SAM C-methyltransferase [Candidatus Scalindua sp.]